MIRLINLDSELSNLRFLINKAYKTVADEMKLTKENAATNPAFISEKDIIEHVRVKNLEYLGYYEKNKLIGCYALERASSLTYYLERLCVLPESRHRKIGEQLLYHSCSRVKDVLGGKEISIGIIDENTLLKEWYIQYGFEETGKKIFDHFPFNVCFLAIKLER